MTVTLTGFREAVQAELTADMGFDFRAGVLEGPVERNRAGCVWVTGKREADDNVADELIELHVRAFQPFVQQQDPALPVNPATVEQLADDLVAALTDRQTTLGPWFVRVTEVELDMETQGVEVTVIGRQTNTFLS